MLVIGCDFHPSWQQVCWVDTMTGETEAKKLVHGSGDWMLRTQKPYPQIVRIESSSRVALVGES